MKKRIFTFLILLIIPFYVFAVEGLRATVSLDYNNRNLQRLNLKFTSTGIPATDELQIQKSNYLAFDGLTELSYNDGTAGSKLGISLIPKMVGNELIAESTSNCYIAWQTYTKDGANVYLSVDGPMKTKEGTVDWQVYMDASTQNDGVADSSKSGSKIHVVTTLPGNFGVTGSRQFHVKTADLLKKPLGAYKANIVATVEAK